MCRLFFTRIMESANLYKDALDGKHNKISSTYTSKYL